MLDSNKAHSQGSVWVPPKTDLDWMNTIIQEFNIHPITAQVLVSRGFNNLDEIHDYLYAQLPDLHPPELFPDMEKAVQRVIRALEEKEKILIYGDNDVDGITATTLMTEFLQLIGVNVIYYIPNKNALKKDLMTEAVRYADEHNCSLLITVDCGITNPLEIEEAVQKNIDVIITDHHEPTSKLGNCVATLNPKLNGSTYPNREITGVGVAFKLAHAITNELIASGAVSSTHIDLKKHLDLVALGTIADMGALLKENRILVQYGLKQIRLGNRVGLSKLCSICDVKIDHITPLEIASKVAPRINSLGRIADPNLGVKLLLIQDPAEAENLAQELNLNNVERQKIERRDSEEVENVLLKHPQMLTEKAIVLQSNKWHAGIIPIIAARIAKQYNRPTLIIAVEKGIGKGSLRTISQFPILPVLKANADLLINFGGHDFAAGLTIKAENIEIFKERLIKSANGVLKDKDIESKLQLDAQVTFEDLNFEFMESLNLLEPFGHENSSPIFYCEARQTFPPKIVGKSHLKFYLQQGNHFLEGIGFGMAHLKPMLLRKNLLLRLAFTANINNFLNKSSIQLQIKDLQIVPFVQEKKLKK